MGPAFDSRLTHFLPPPAMSSGDVPDSSVWHCDPFPRDGEPSEKDPDPIYLARQPFLLPHQPNVPSDDIASSLLTDVSIASVFLIPSKHLHRIAPSSGNIGARLNRSWSFFSVVVHSSAWDRNRTLGLVRQIRGVSNGHRTFQASQASICSPMRK